MLHAQQVSASMSAERGTAAMVSRSDDGEIIVPALRVGGHVPIRGSGGKSRKGGAGALQMMINHVKDGRPAVLAVDGPRGPRGHVHKGIAMLAQKTGAAVLTPVVVPSSRWILKKTWDQLQIPLPFSRIDTYLGQPLMPVAGESTEDFARRIETQLNILERRVDPEQAGGSRIDGSEPRGGVATEFELNLRNVPGDPPLAFPPRPRMAH